MALSTTDIASWIAQLEVEGLTIKDLDEFPDEVNTIRDGPLLIPAPRFKTDISIIRDSFGSGSVAKTTVYYTLNYRMLYAELGTDRKMSDVYQNMVALTDLFTDTIIANDYNDYAVDLYITSISAFGVVLDPSDNPFYGVDIAIRVKEFEN